MSRASGAPVIVGVDGSSESSCAVRLAADQARRRQRPLRLVHVLGWPLNQAPAQPQAGGPLDGGPRFQAERLLAQAIADARRAAPDLPVHGEIADGQPATVLVARSPHAALIVLGDRGLGGFGSLLLGSVALQVSAHAECPVLVARGTERESGPVVVGVDGSRLSELAIGYAVEEAVSRRTELVAVHAYRQSSDAGPDDPPPDRDANSPAEEADRILAGSLAAWRERYPDLPVVHRLVPHRPAAALVEESTRAGLVVVGARGRGGFAGLVTGSVSHALLHHADCPVAVVRRGPELPTDGADRPPVPSQSPAPGA